MKDEDELYDVYNIGINVDDALELIEEGLVSGADEMAEIDKKEHERLPRSVMKEALDCWLEAPPCDIPSKLVDCNYIIKTNTNNRFICCYSLREVESIIFILKKEYALDVRLRVVDSELVIRVYTVSDTYTYTALKGSDRNNFSDEIIKEYDQVVKGTDD